MFTKKVIIRFLLLIIALGFFGPGAGARPLARYLPGEILVKFKPAANQPQVKLASFPAGATVHRSFPELGWKLIKLPQGMSVEQALAEFQARGDVAEVEPNYRIELHAATNDPRLSSLWGLSKIGAIEAWDYVKNPAAVVVAVLDTGVNHRHPDLAPNMWRNPLEIPANNRDDDNNGYVDDLHGIDVMSGDSDPFDEDDGHGSHVAGSIGAVSNNAIGVAGVNPFVQILAVRIFSADSFSGTAAVASAYDYLIALKKRGVNIRVVNNSWGGAFPSKAILDAVCAASDHGILSVCSAGNDRHDTDHAPAFPANYDCDGVLSVAASTEQDEPAIFSNFGLRTVHLAAPGDGILSTYKGKPDYATLSGTSMASPHVAGAAALLLARKPDLSIGDLRALLLGSVDRLPAWENKVVSHGRLNLLKAMQNLANNTLPTLPQTADGFPISIASRNSLGRLGNDKSLRSGVSADGRFIAFTSDATNLVSNDRNGKTDIFLHDRETRTTLRVTQTFEGVEANGESTDLVISGNGQFIAFQSAASNLVPGDNNGLPDIFVYDRMTRQIELISIASTGGIGNGESGAPSLSADGRYVAFASDASNLVPNDTNRRRDVFVRDRQQRTTTRVSINSAGLPGNGTSDFPWMSKDGRYVAFHTDSNNLIANDFNEAYDIYLHDRNLRVTQIVSVNSSGALGNDSSGFPCVSADGRFVAFQSFAGNLDAGGVSGVWEIYLRDLQNGTTRRISVSAGGARPDESAFRPVMSADGRWIAFESNANTLVPGPYQSIWSIFLHDRLTGRLMRLPINAGGEAPLDNSFLPWISETGRFLSFMSWAFNVAPGDGNATTADIFVFDRGTSIPDLIVRKTGDALFTGAGVLGAAQVQRMTQAVTPSGTVTFDVMLENAGPATEAFVLHATAPGAGWQLRVSDPQSRLITPEITSNAGWTSPALAPGNNLLLKCEITALAGPGEIKFALEINARTIGGTASLDRVFAVCTRQAPPPHFFVASRNTSGTLGSDNSQEGVIDAEGNYVVFSSDAPNLAPNDENFDTDLFLWDRNAGVISCLSLTTAGQTGNGWSRNPAISANGRVIAFQSRATNLIPDDTNEREDVFIVEPQFRRIERVSVSNTGAQANRFSENPALSGDGQLVVFESLASNLVPGDNQRIINIYLRDRGARTTTCLSLNGSGQFGNGDSFSPQITPDGRFVIFRSFADNLATGDTNDASDVFLYDRTRQILELVSATAAGFPGNAGSGTASISDDGRWVLFGSSANNLVPGDTNEKLDAFLWNRETRELRRLDFGLQASRFLLSPDGRWIAYSARRTDLAPGSAAQFEQVHIYNMRTGELSPASRTSAGDFGNGASEIESFSRNGQYVLFRTWAKNLIAETSSEARQVLLMDQRLFQPDQWIRRETGPYRGEGIFSELEQTVEQTIAAGQTISGRVNVQNRSEFESKIIVTANAGAPVNPAFWEITYIDAATGNNVSFEVQGNGWQTASLAPAASQELRVLVKSIATADAPLRLMIEARSSLDPTRRDAVTMIAWPDSDSDQLPDAWENQIFGSSNRSNGQTDFDRDGASDLTEYWARTNPLDAQSLLRITAMDRQPGNQITLRWPSASHRFYTVEMSDELGRPFTAPISNLPGTPPENSAVVSPVKAVQFMRIRVEPP